MKITNQTKIEQKPHEHNGTTAYYKMLIDKEETGVTMVVTGPDLHYQTDDGEKYENLIDAFKAAGHEVEA